jgi:hypothetical protein
MMVIIMIMCRVKAQGEWHALLGGPLECGDSFIVEAQVQTIVGWSLWRLGLQV